MSGTLIEVWAFMKSFQPKAGADGSEPPVAACGGEGKALAGAQACAPAAPPASYTFQLSGNRERVPLTQV